MAGLAGTSLRAELETLGITGTFAQPFVERYHRAVSAARAPVSIGQFVRHLKETCVHG